MRLIDADALKKEVDNFPNCYNGWSDTYDKAYIIGAIDEAPTIEPKRGKWIWDEQILGLVCSECKELGVERSNFCPNCGADMRSKGNETKEREE